MMAANFARKGMTSYEVGTSTNGTPVNLVTTACMATNPARACWSPMVRGSPAGPNTMLVNAAASITVARPLYMPAATLPAVDGFSSAASSKGGEVRWYVEGRDVRTRAGPLVPGDDGRRAATPPRRASSATHFMFGLKASLPPRASQSLLVIFTTKLSILWKGEQREGFFRCVTTNEGSKNAFRAKEDTPTLRGPRV